MKPFVLLLFALSIGWHARAAPTCHEIFALGGKEGFYEDSHCFNFDCWSQESLRAVPLAEAIFAKNPAIAFHQIKILVALALENAVQHGRSPLFSEVEISAQKLDTGIRVQILNNRWHPLPETLKDKVFEVGTPPFVVPKAERDTSRGNLGLATKLMLTVLNELYLKPNFKNPTIAWREVQSPLTGKPKVLFELYLPD